MTPSSAKGNSPEVWNKLLEFVDEKLQLGLLDHLSRVSSYHFEDDVLFIQPSNQSDYDYLKRDTNHQQLLFLAQELIPDLEKIKIQKPEEG